MNESRLQELGARNTAARQAYEEAQRELHDAVRQARAGGLTLRRIAELSGLSFARVHQLTRGGADEHHD